MHDVSPLDSWGLWVVRKNCMGWYWGENVARDGGLEIVMVHDWREVVKDWDLRLKKPMSQWWRYILIEGSIDDTADEL